MPTLTFKVTLDEARQIQTEAKQRKLSLSEYLRGRALHRSHRPRVRQVRCERTGAMIFSSAAGAPPLNTETVRQMLSDFP